MPTMLCQTDAAADKEVRERLNERKEKKQVTVRGVFATPLCDYRNVGGER